VLEEGEGEGKNIVFKEWYSKNKSKYSLMLTHIENILKVILKADNINIYTIQSRVKTYESLVEKIYENGFPFIHPTEIKDIAGIRIITYLLSDVGRISNLINKSKSSFDILDIKNKALELGVDRMGYNSIHIIATLSKNRQDLPEYAGLKDMKFEIQIKTILQHAWAEIEHDRVYKYEGAMPEEIPRRFGRLSGMLEEIDVIFQEISNDMEKYPNMILDKIKKGELDIPIDATTLKQYVVGKFSELTNINIRPRYGATGTERILEELSSLGIKTLADLDSRVNTKVREAYQKQGKYAGINDNITALIRHILMANNTKSYFEKAWNNHFQTIDPTALELLGDSGADTDEIKKHLDISTKGFG
jgi:ppGpp synthetase/RelA/SpoT-type nucleotidyltranferase